MRSRLLTLTAVAAVVAPGASAGAAAPTSLVALEPVASGGPRALVAIVRESPSTVSVLVAAKGLDPASSTCLTEEEGIWYFVQLPPSRRPGAVVTVETSAALTRAEARGAVLVLRSGDCATGAVVARGAIGAPRPDLDVAIVTPREPASGLPTGQRARGLIAVQRTPAGARARVRVSTLLALPGWRRPRAALTRARCCALLGTRSTLTATQFNGVPLDPPDVFPASVRTLKARSLVVRDGRSGRIGIQIPLS